MSFLLISQLPARSLKASSEVLAFSARSKRPSGKRVLQSSVMRFRPPKPLRPGKGTKGTRGTKGATGRNRAFHGGDSIGFDWYVAVELHMMPGTMGTLKTFSRTSVMAHDASAQINITSIN